jgi:Rod binding domain-containing protein
MQIGSATDANVILPAGTPAPKTDADKKLLDAAKQFEGVFVQQLVQEMLKGARGDDAAQGGEAIYQDMADQTMTQSLVDSGAFGLAGTLYAYMKRSGA